MWWVVTIVVVVGVLAFMEWRSRNKPLVPGLGDHWGTHSAAQNGEGQTLIGRHNTDRHI
jgi:hypothetical protein